MERHMENQSSIKDPCFPMVFGEAVHSNRGCSTLQEHGVGWDLYLVWRFGFLEACTAGVQFSQVHLGAGEGGAYCFYMPDRNTGRKSLVSRGDGSAQAQRAYTSSGLPLGHLVCATSSVIREQISKSVLDKQLCGTIH
jgi:hypothetical protein